MVAQDNRGGTRLNMVQEVVSGASLTTRLHDDTDSQKNKQFSYRNGYHSKVRKPYTITKQRERWTDEEHKKFLEALKLYGRAWRRIEEHIGTKTAVQIRSHAQKFFSKVVRESGGNTTASVEPIEIPPPRPKRKPTHPYPRKMVNPLNTDPLTLKQPIRLSSPDSPASELENQSPTSVLSVVAADISDSMTSNLSLSPASQAASLGSVKVLSESLSSTEDSNPLTATPQMSSVLDQKLLKERKFFEEDPGKEKCTRSLKLFGRTVLLTEYPPSTQTSENSKVLPDAHEKSPSQLVQRNENTWSTLVHVNPEFFYCLPIQKEVSNQVGTGCSESLQWWQLPGGMAFPFVPFLKEEAMRHFQASECKDIQEKGIWTEESSSGSSSGSVNGEHNSDKVFNGKTLGWQLPYVKKEPLPASEPGHWEEKASPENCTRGFVPYKKRMAARDFQCSTVTGNKREEKRINLCL